MNAGIMDTKTHLLQKCWAAILPLSLALMISSCNKNIDYFVPDPGQVMGPDTNWVSNITTAMPVSFLKNTLLLKPVTDSLDLQKNDTADNAAGLKCAITANSFSDTLGHLATGTVKVEMMMLTKKGDFIRMDKPTVANGKVLSSSGIINVKISKAGSTLIIGQNEKLSLQVYNPLATSQNKLYFQEFNTTGEFNWLEDFAGSRNEIVPNNYGYDIKTNKLGWMSASKPLETLALTNIAISLPAQYTNANAVAYLVYSDTKSVVNLSANTSIKKFGGTNLPGGKAATVVVLSKQGNDYYAAFKTITTNSSIGNISNQIVTVLPVKITINAIEQQLNAL